MQTIYSWAKKTSSVSCYSAWQCLKHWTVLSSHSLLDSGPHGASVVHPDSQLACFHKSFFGLVSSGSCFCLTSIYPDDSRFSKQEELRTAVWLGNCLESFGGLLGGCDGDYRGDRTAELTLGYLSVLPLPVGTSVFLSCRHCLFWQALVQPVKPRSPNRKSLIFVWIACLHQQGCKGSCEHLFGYWKCQNELDGPCPKLFTV